MSHNILETEAYNQRPLNGEDERDSTERKKNIYEGMANGWYVPGGFDTQSIAPQGEAEVAMLREVKPEPLTVDFVRDYNLETRDPGDVEHSTEVDC